MRYPWWLHDAPPGTATCTPKADHRCHLRFRLTCAQYAHLIDRSGNRCELCGKPAAENVAGKLYIDHDWNHGIWAVRGLLCRTCNSTEHLPGNKDWADEYRANAWYLQMLASRNVPLMPPEAPMGYTVRDHAYRPWVRDESGWAPGYRFIRPMTARTWRHLVSRYGPHNVARDLEGVLS